MMMSDAAAEPKPTHVTHSDADREYVKTLASAGLTVRVLNSENRPSMKLHDGDENNPQPNCHEYSRLHRED